MVTQDAILSSLRDVIDPDFGANVVDLGFIRGVDIEDDHIHVRMTLTMPGCPLARFLVMQVKSQAAAVAEGREVDVDLVDEPWIPPWA